MKNRQKWIVAAAIIGYCVTALSGGDVLAEERPQPIIEISDQEIADAPASDKDEQKGDYFSIDSDKDDVARIQGEPTEKFFDGRNMVWYYGDDVVYFNYYGRVVGADNKSGKLKID